jgi:16S rRNA (uracil1498-N3)-methyltransferase
MAGLSLFRLIAKRMHRFFIEPCNIQDRHATLDGAEAHHLRHVLRLGPGEEIELFDGNGGVYRARISQVGKEIELIITQRHTVAPESPALCIAQGILKGKKMDFVVQKACELGVTTFIPFHSNHCAAAVPRDAKTFRWEKIIMEACKQCGRPIPLEVGPVADFNALLAAAGRYACKLIFWEKEPRFHLSQLAPLAATPSVIALIGPEGGFAEAEINKAAQAGFTAVSLGRRTLRAETAAISVMAILQYLGNKL